MPKPYQLSQLAVIKVTGDDAATFLQGQLTADVVQQAYDSWLFGGHCDAKGKLWSILRIVKTETAFYLLQPTESAAASLAQLEKFGVFSKVTFSDISAQTGVTFTPDLAQADFTVTTSEENQLTLGLGEASLTLSFAAPKDAEPGDDLWRRFEIEQGVAQLTEATIGEYVPQMVGLDALGGVSFKKGCYIGQETVARMHYLGQNKRLPRLLEGQVSELPAAGLTLERKLGDNWRRAGAVLNAVRYDNSEVVVLAVLPADIEDTATIRIKGDEQSQLTLRPKFDNQEISNE